MELLTHCSPPLPGWRAGRCVATEGVEGVYVRRDHKAELSNLGAAMRNEESSGTYSMS
jgi:hypothetical protein